MEFSEDNIDKQFPLIENIYNYICDILNKKIDISNETTLKSIYNIITVYYNERIDYDSDYFDPYAYVNDSNEDILEINSESDDNKIKLLEHYKDYLEKIIYCEIEESETIDSHYKMIKYYYGYRCDMVSKYYDSYAHLNNLNKVFDELYILDEDDSETNLSENDSDTDSKYETLTENDSDTDSKY